MSARSCPRLALAALALLLVATACRDAPRDDEDRPRPAPLTLRETAAPGDRYAIAEVSTLERVARGRDTELVHEIELGKHVEVEIVQVEPDGQPVRYRKRFERFRQRAATRVDGRLADEETFSHPVEGHTVEYVWRGASSNGWSTRWVEGPGATPPSELPAAFEQRAHPWLPEAPVRPGESWTALELPLALPEVPAAHVRTELRLAQVEQRDRARVAHVEVVVTIAPPPQAPPDALRGALEGRFLFQLPDEARGIPGRMLREQLAGTLHTTPTGADEPAVELRVVVFRATE